MRLFEMVELDVPTPSGTKRMKLARQTSDPEVIINFNAAPFADELQASYAMTPNVDKAFFERWLADNADLEAVCKNLIFAAPTKDAPTTSPLLTRTAARRPRL
jgi:hypothetical protein